jgi:hypothetical protein
MRRERPGVFQRTKAWWELRRLRIPDEEKANPKHLVVLELDGSVQAYAIYRRYRVSRTALNARLRCRR